MNKKQIKFQFVVCINNEGYSASLEPRKIYRTVQDDTASQHQFIRIIDESGEDYLYPKACFAPIDVSQQLAEALSLAV